MQFALQQQRLDVAGTRQGRLCLAALQHIDQPRDRVRALRALHVEPRVDEPVAAFEHALQRFEVGGVLREGGTGALQCLHLIRRERVVPGQALEDPRDTLRGRVHLRGGRVLAAEGVAPDQAPDLGHLAIDDLHVVRHRDRARIAFHAVERLFEGQVHPASDRRQYRQDHGEAAQHFSANRPVAGP